jgi:hypothetical protein
MRFYPSQSKEDPAKSKIQRMVIRFEKGTVIETQKPISREMKRGWYFEEP